MLHMSNRMNRMMNQSSRLIPCQTCLGRQTMSPQTITRHPSRRAPPQPELTIAIRNFFGLVRSQNAPVGSPKLFLTAQGVNRGGTPQKSAAAPHFACGHFALSPHHDRCALRRDRAPAHHKTGPCSTVGVPRAPRTTSPAQNAGNHRTAAAASRSTRDELRASRALLRETTGPGTGAGL